MIWFIPVLLGLLSFIGAMVVRSLVKLSNDVNDIKVLIAKIDTKHDDLARRVEKIEINMFQ